MKELPWEYCECGCHAHELSVGDFYRWMFQDLENGKVYLNSGHKWGTHLGTFNSVKECKDFVRKEFKEHVEKRTKAYKEYADD